MVKEYIRNEIEYIDDIVLLTIIACCRELAIKGVPMHKWDADSVLDVFDEVIDGYSLWEYWFTLQKTSN